jgi:uncharacterized damage-inducible protein DinB
MDVQRFISLSLRSRMSEDSFLSRSRYYLAYEYPVKLRLAVAGLPHDVIWWRANEDSNSIGNLMVHLAGNISQWIIEGIGGRPVQRDRASEFSIRTGPEGSELVLKLEKVTSEADAVLERLDTGDLDRSVTIQGRETTILSAVYHVVEHFSMHTGQILLIAKMRAPGVVKFYEDAGGLAIPLWGGREGMPMKGTD